MTCFGLWIMDIPSAIRTRRTVERDTALYLLLGSADGPEPDPNFDVSPIK